MYVHTYNVCCNIPNMNVFECVFIWLEFLLDETQPDLPASYDSADPTKKFESDRNYSKITDSSLVVKVLATTRKLPENI